MTENQDNARKRIDALRRAYARQLPERVEAMETLWAGQKGSNRTKAGLSELARQAHGLAGSGATYGFADVSQAARELELRIEAMVEAGGSLDEQRAKEADAMLIALKQACNLAAAQSGKSIG
ncbi:MAG: Hpt domain-containing protein [Nitrospirota bacterium]|nr:Hpt domain-containing protein [Nitrospirota bacterium]